MFKNIILSLLLIAGSANAQTIKIIVPFSPGGIVDQSARGIEQILSKRLPYNFVIEYQTGASGNIASNHVSKIKSKEVTLLTHSASIVNNSFNASAEYDLLKDFAHVANLGSTHMALVTNSKKQISTVKELLQSPNSLFYGTSGEWSASHMAGEVFRYSTGKEMTPVFYKGESAGLNDVFTNTLDFMFVSTSLINGNDRLVILGVSGITRHQKMLSVPTLLEQGIRGFESGPNWVVLLANKDADPMVLDKIRNAVVDGFTDKTDSDLYGKTGLDVDKKKILKVTEFLQSELEKVKRIRTRLSK